MITEQEEIERLTQIYKSLPPNRFALAQGLITQAARIRVSLDKLWNDILENGEQEMFSQSDKTDPYERERPASRTFTARDKAYQSIIKQLDGMLPEGEAVDALNEFMNDGDG